MARNFHTCMWGSDWSQQFGFTSIGGQMNSKIRYGSILRYQDTNLHSLCKVYRPHVNKEESKHLESWILQRFYHFLKFFIE